MTTALTFFPVDNGDMVLISLDSGRNILIDTNIRSDADDPNGEAPDVASQLRKKLPRDDQGRLYVNVFILSHPDQDHCRGLMKHFHLGPPAEWNKDDDKILIREMWSSPMVFRRASRNHTLCDNAKAWATEARRRVKYYRDGNPAMEGERILILGEDENNKTDDLANILVKCDDAFSRVNGTDDDSLVAQLLAPLPMNDNEDTLSKNKSSIILQLSLAGGGESGKCLYLTGGDAEVAIWEELWNRHAQDPKVLTYDVLLTPHHCSWHSLSYESWSDKGEKAEICLGARHALSQANPGAVLIASSKQIVDDRNDPPCIRAKREYENIADDCNGAFECVGDNSHKALEIKVDKNGPKLTAKHLSTAAMVGPGIIGSQPIGHG